MPELPEATLKAGVEVDHVDHEALVAVPLLSTEIVGECRFIRLPSYRAVAGERRAQDVATGSSDS